MTNKKIEQTVQDFQQFVSDSKQSTPQALIKRSLQLVEKQIVVLEQMVTEDALLEPSDARMLSSYIDDLLKISKEYRDADINPLEQFKGLTPEEENDFILELAKSKGIIKDGTVVHYYNEQDKDNKKNKNG